MCTSWAHLEARFCEEWRIELCFGNDDLANNAFVHVTLCCSNRALRAGKSCHLRPILDSCILWAAFAGAHNLDSVFICVNFDSGIAELCLDITWSSLKPTKKSKIFDWPKIMVETKQLGG